MTSRTSTPFKILFEKLIRTHHSCKSKKTPVYSYLKSIMPEKPRFEVHLPITKSNWNFQVWLFKQERLWKSYRLRPGLITKSHALLDNLNSVIQFCQENGKATRSSRCCNWCQTSDTPSYDQDIVMHPTEFYRMSMKEHKPHQTQGKRVQLTWMSLNTSEGSVRQLKYSTFYLPPEENLECIAHLVC